MTWEHVNVRLNPAQHNQSLLHTQGYGCDPVRGRVIIILNTFRDHPTLWICQYVYPKQPAFDSTARHQRQRKWGLRYRGIGQTPFKGEAPGISSLHIQREESKAIYPG